MLLRVGHETEAVSELEMRKLYLLCLKHGKGMDAEPLTERQWDLVEAMIRKFITENGDLELATEECLERSRQYALRSEG